jgi:hypothetical protein
MVRRCGQKPSGEEVSISLVYALGLWTDQTYPPEDHHRSFLSASVSPHRHTHTTMNAGQPEDNNADNSNIDAGNSSDDDNDGSVIAAGGVNARERRGQRVWQRHSSHNNDEDIEYSYYWLRRRKRYENSNLSSLTPAQIMEQETYYRFTEVVIHRVVYILQLILLH